MLYITGTLPGKNISYYFANMVFPQIKIIFPFDLRVNLMRNISSHTPLYRRCNVTKNLQLTPYLKTR